MKALIVALVALLLGAMLVVLLLGGSGGRRGRGAATAPSTPVAAESGVPERSDTSEPAPSVQLTESGVRQAAEAGSARPARTFLEGTVIGDGAPIPGASLELYVYEELRASGTTDARGRFRLECPPISNASQLRVGARGFVTAERTLPGRPAGGTVMLGNLRLQRGQRIEGRVIDGQGAGISGAEIRIEPYQSGSDLFVAKGQSGAEGRFEVSDCPTGTLLVSARAKGFGEVSVTHSPGQPLEMRLEPGTALRLLVVTPQGSPVAGASVQIQPREPGRTVKREAPTDAEGRVVFEGLAQREWNVRVTHGDYRTNSVGMVRATGAEERLVCVPWPAIEGRVVAPDGKAPPAGTRVQALPASAPSDRITTLEGGQPVAADGTFRVSGLRGGDWRVHVSAPGFAPTLSAPVKVGIEGTIQVGAIELASGGGLSLILRRQSQPVAGAGVEIFATEPSPAQMWAFATDPQGADRAALSDAKGHVRLLNQSAGTIWLAIYAPGSPPTKSGPHVIRDGPEQAPVEVALVPGGRFVGRAFEDGKPLPHALIRILDRSGKLGFPLTLVSAVDGRYTSAWLPPGRYQLEAFTPEDPRSGSGGVEHELAAGEEKNVDLGR
jgi:hypothetical protein